MIQLKSLSLKNIVSFKETTVPLNASGITFVRGLNLDADPAQPTGNGAGKSLLLSCPSNVFYFSPPLALKRKAKKELLGKGSVIAIDLVAQDGHEYRVEQTATKYKITRNGEDLGLRTVPLAEKFIREKLFPISELVYYTTCYVSTQRPFRMQSDSNADRLAHLSELFTLDDYDHIKRYFLDRLGSIRESELKLQVLERDLLEVNGKLKRLKKAAQESGKIDVTALKRQRKKLDAEIATLVDEEFKCKSLLNDLKTLLSVEKELDALRSRYKVKRKPEEYVKYLKSQRKLVRALDTYRELMRSYKASVKDLQASLDKLGIPDMSRKKAESRLEAYEAELDKMREKLSDLKSRRKEHDRLKAAVDDLLSELKDLGFSRKKAPDLEANYDDEIADCRTKLKLKRLLDDHNHDDGTCPTCLSAIDIEDIRKMVADATKRLPKLEAKRDAQRVWRRYEEAAKKLKDFDFDPSQIEELESRIKAAGPKIEELESVLKVWSRRETLERALSKVEKPERPQEEPEVDMTLEQIDDTIELCEDIIKHLSARDKLIQNNAKLEGLRTVERVQGEITEATERKHRVSKALDKVRTELAGIVKQLDEANATQHEHDVYVTQRKELEQKIEKLRPAIEDKKLLEILVKAYSTKGLKTIVANSICGLLEQNLNAYSNLIFNEPFVFSVSAQDSGLSIIVDRGNGHVSDVRNLSGAESNAFRLLFVMSLLPLLPSEKRINTLTLDEPCSHMDEISRTKFLHVFLPALAEIVPHIFIITPNPEDYCEGSVQWVVKKHKGKSSVIMDGSVDLMPEQDVGAVLKKARKAVSKIRACKQK